MAVKELKQPINKNVIKCLESMLEMAKEGDIHAIAIAGVTSSGGGINVFEASWMPLHLLGELRVIEHEIVDMDVERRADLP